MKSYSIVFILTVLVIIPSIAKGSPFGLLSAFSGNTQNAQNSITQGERNRSLEFVRTVLVTPLYGPGISYKFGLLSRLLRQFSQISQNRPTNEGSGNILPSSISKTLHFNRGITVSSGQSEGAITHATISTTETDIDEGDKEPKKADVLEKDMDSEKDAEIDSEKESEKNSDKDSEDDSDKDTNSDKDLDNESDKNDEKDSSKDDEKDSDKDDEKESEKESEKEFVNFDFNSKDLSNADSKDDSSLALFTNALTSVTNNNGTNSFSISTNTRSNFGDTKKDINGPNNKNSVSSTNTRINSGDSKKDTNIKESSNQLNPIKVLPTTINMNLQAGSGKNLTGTGGYHYAPQGYRYTRNGPSIIFQPSEIINTLAG